MKPVEKIGELLKQPMGNEWFEMYHQFKLLKIEIGKLKSNLLKCQNDRTIMESHLNSTIQDLSDSNEKIRMLRRQELEANDKRLKFEASKLEQITGSMTSSMAFIDTNYTYRYINHKYTEWFGVEKVDIINRTIAQVAGEPFFKMAKPYYDTAFSGKSFSKEIDTHIANTDIRLVIIATYVPAYNIEGKNMGAYIYGTDVTENKIKEEEIQASKVKLAQTNEKLKTYIESNVQLEQFAFVAAHDMKAPMRSISSFSDLLKATLKNDLNQKQKDYFEYISTGTKRLSMLVTDLLNYSKVGGNTLELGIENINNIVNQVTQYLAVAIEEKNAEIVVERLPEQLVVDKVKIYQVFQNLISNAIKFTAPDVLPKVEISCSEEQEYYEFKVKDNGIGMDEQFHAQIFESFKQLNSKSEYEGTGLGLSICKKIIEHHQGQIQVISKPNEGSCFVFTISKKLQVNKS